MKICGMAFLYAIPCILFFRNPNQECITSVQIVFYEKIVDFISADGFTFSRLFAKKRYMPIITESAVPVSMTVNSENGSMLRK